MTAPTSPWNIPLFGVGDSIGPIASVFNSQSNALNTALNSLQNTSFTQYNTRALLPTSGNNPQQHATVTADATASNNGDYYWNATLNAWVPVAPAAARVTRVAAFNTSSSAGTYAAIPWDSDIVNVGGLHSTGTNPSRFTCTIPGLYSIDANARINTTTGSGAMAIAKNGTQIADTLFSITPASGSTPFAVTRDLVQLAAGDYLEVQVASSAVSAAITAASARVYFVRP